jgi:pimeloyl-ACP methyl ester carboxylesterase
LKRYYLGYETSQELGLTLHHLSAVEQGPMPAIIFLHGFTGSKEHHLPLRLALADLGYLVVSFDARDHGDRLSLPELWNRCRECFLDTFLGILMDTVDETVRVFGHLRASSGVDPQRIGLVGGSMGAMIGLMSIPRLPGLRAAVTMAGTTDLLRWQEETMGHEHYQFQKGEAGAATRSRLESYEAIPRAAAFYPVRLLMVHGGSDRIVPPRGQRQLYRRLRPFYAGEPSRLKCSVYPGLEHDTSPALLEEVYAWLRKHL